MLAAPSVQTLKHVAESIVLSLKHLSTILKISPLVVVVESGWQNRKRFSISLMLANRVYAKSCEKRATSVDLYNCVLRQFKVGNSKKLNVTCM